ncbi:MAG TPA: NEW3 domain-containing protein [bacterium]
MIHKSIFKQLIFLFMCVLLFPALTQSQGTMFNQRDDEYRLLGLKRAKAAYEVAAAELDRQKALREKNLISDVELARARNSFSDAEVNYQQSLLAVLFEGQYVAVVEAIKYQRENGSKHVRVKLENTSGGDAEFKQLVNVDDELFRSLQPNVIHDVYVSLLNEQNAIISQPYEQKIEMLRYGDPVVLDFALLQDLDVVTVNLVYGKGSQRAPKIYLQKDATVNKVVVQSEQFSQEVELGVSASYDLTLELFSGETNTFKLEVVNLPQQINRYFVDPTTSARLSQFKFAESTNTRRAALQVYLPDRPSDEVVIDRPIPFFVLVIPREQAEGLTDLRNHEWTQKEIDQLNLGYVKLDLVPRGVGKLLVRAPQLYYAIKVNESVEMNLDVINEGTRGLNNVEIKADTPLNWSKSIEPSLVPQLNISEERRIALSFTPPPTVAVGRYEVRIRSSSLSDGQPINGEDKIVTIEIQPEANILGTALIILLIVGLVLGIVVYGVRLSRR